jgi:beta-phosphoglucomutase-like phosphatase (HAD superfamily)/dTDP-glucose pyrophosphorylase
MKLIIFDLDGVLIDAKKIHFEMLNKALASYHQTISWEEHLNKYDGLKTVEKLNLLSKEKNLPLSAHNIIWAEKQKYTLKQLQLIKKSFYLKECFEQLSKKNYKLACASNSIRKTVITTLTRLGIIEYFDLIVSNEDVKNSKPHPEMYWKCMLELGVLPEDTLIVEDSPHGLIAAYRSNAHVLRVKNSNEVNFENIETFINNINNKNKIMSKWKDNKLNVLIPMAGAGSRFEKAGYTFPKPLIEIKGKPMIQVVIENLNIDANYIYIVQKTHRQKYNLDTLLNLITPNCKVIEVEGLTEGAACTALLAKDFINNKSPLFFANSDQFVEWNSAEFMYKMQETNADGGIVTFKATHPKWSFAKINSYNNIVEVAEKNPISDNATVGYYYWKHGSDFVKYAEQMIEKNIRTNNEFYVCPVFNEAIKDGKNIKSFNVKKMWGLGTPEDLSYFIENYSL